MPQHLTADYLLRVGETIPVTLDYATELGDDTIDSSTWSVPSGVTQAESTTAGKTVTLWATAVTAGTIGVATNTLVSVGGKTLKRSQVLRVATT